MQQAQQAAQTMIKSTENLGSTIERQQPPLPKGMSQDHHCVFPAKIGPCPVEAPPPAPSPAQKTEGKDAQAETAASNANQDLSDLMYFSTKLFMIRYQEEEVELNDIGHFRIEMALPAAVSTQTKELQGKKPKAKESPLLSQQSKQQ